MRKFILSILALTSLASYAQSEAEEAIILNQELEFLEDSVNRKEARAITPEASKDKALNEPSLEKTFFGNTTEEDAVSTRTASPKRRGI